MLIAIILAAIALTALTATFTGGAGGCADHYSAYYRSMARLTDKK